MKIYVVAHENIVYPKEYRKVEIEKEEVLHYIKRSVAYDDMLENLNDMDSLELMEDEYVAELVNNWLTNQEEEFYKLGYYDIGDFDLIIEN